MTTRVRITNEDGHLLEIGFVFMPEGREGPRITIGPAESREFILHRGTQLRLIERNPILRSVPDQKPHIDAVLA
jgi:hypothetical protein